MERIDGHTLLIGLMAYPIRHSMSPTMHNNAFAKLGLNYAYLAFEIDNDKLEKAVDAIRTLDMRVQIFRCRTSKRSCHTWISFHRLPS